MAAAFKLGPDSRLSSRIGAGRRIRVKSGASEAAANKLAAHLEALGAACAIVPAAPAASDEGPAARPSKPALPPNPPPSPPRDGAARHPVPPAAPDGGRGEAGIDLGELADAAEAGRVSLSSIDGSDDDASGEGLATAAGSSPAAGGERLDPFSPPDEQLPPPALEVAGSPRSETSSLSHVGRPGQSEPGEPRNMGHGDPFAPPDEQLPPPTLEVASPAVPHSANGPGGIPSTGSLKSGAPLAAPDSPAGHPASGPAASSDRISGTSASLRRPGGVRGFLCAAAGHARARFAAGVALSAIAALLAAHLVGSVRERSYDDSRERVAAAAAQVDDLSSWRELERTRAEEAETLSQRRTGVIASAGFAGLAAAAAFALGWFRLVDWAAMARRLEPER